MCSCCVDFQVNECGCGVEERRGMTGLVESPASFGAKTKTECSTCRAASDLSESTVHLISRDNSDEQDSGHASEPCGNVSVAMRGHLLHCAKDKIVLSEVKEPAGRPVGQRIVPKEFGTTKDELRGYRRYSDDWVANASGRRCDLIGDPKAELTYGIKESPGYRSKMEDRISFRSKFMTVQTLARQSEALIPKSLQGPLNDFLQLSDLKFDASYNLLLPFDFIAVFDGHGGTEVADALADSLAEYIKSAFHSKQQKLDMGRREVPIQMLQHERSVFPSGKALPGQLMRKVPNLVAGLPAMTTVHDSFASRDGSDCGGVSMDIDSKLQTAVTSISEDSVSTQFSDEMSNNSAPFSLKELEEGIEEAFMNFNEQLPEVQERTVGSTAVVSMISAAHIIIANVGDSRAVLRHKGTSFRLSRDHKPDQADEEDRIRECGGRVWDFNGRRVMGLLAMTRAFGDDCLQSFGITAQPEVTIIPRSDDDEFLILACDGLWDVVSDDEACELVERCFRRAEERDAPAVSACRVAASVLFRAAFAKGSNDNISVVVVDLRQDSVNNNQ